MIKQIVSYFWPASRYLNRIKRGWSPSSRKSLASRDLREHSTKNTLCHCLILYTEQCIGGVSRQCPHWQNIEETQFFLNILSVGTLNINHPYAVKLHVRRRRRRRRRRRFRIGTRHRRWTRPVAWELIPLTALSIEVRQ